MDVGSPGQSAERSWQPWETNQLVTPSNCEAELVAGKHLAYILPRNRQDMRIGLPRL